MDIFKKSYHKIINAIVIVAMALLFLSSCTKPSEKHLIIYNNENSNVIAEYPVKVGDYFSISFIHSVNNSPVTEYYRFDNDNNIDLYKTVYYNYGAGIETELNNNEKFTFGEDGSMITYDIQKNIYPLLYYLSSIYDHKLRINDGDEISLWELCGKNTTINIVVK